LSHAALAWDHSHAPHALLEPDFSADGSEELQLAEIKLQQTLGK
jgi:hypothetical protein